MTAIHPVGTQIAPDEGRLRRPHACWRACSYPAVEMIYLQFDPLLREPSVPPGVDAPEIPGWKWPF
jgi:hypothetical protein